MMLPPWRAPHRGPSHRSVATLVVALVLVLGGVGGSTLASGPAGDAPPVVPVSLAAELQLILDRNVQRRPLAGITAAVVLPDGSLWTGASGRANVSTGRWMQ